MDISEVDTLEPLKQKYYQFTEHVREVFKVDKITRKLLEDIGHENNINTFQESLIYFGNDDFINSYLHTCKKKENVIQKDSLMKKIKCINELLKIFYGDVFNGNKIRMLTNIKFEKVHLEYIEKYERDIRIIFPEMSKLTLRTPHQLIKWLGRMMHSFFGGFMDIKCSDRLKMTENESRSYYYEYELDVHKYMSLLKRRPSYFLKDDIKPKLEEYWSKNSEKEVVC